MAEIYGHRWTSAYGDNPNEGAALTWAKGLVGITPRQVADGLSSCIASADPWPPTLPEFRARCLGIPTFEWVRSAITSGAAATPFLALAWQHIDGHRLRHASADKADRMIRGAYDCARDRVMRGEALPELPVASIGADSPEAPKKASAERAAAACAEIVEALSITGKGAAAGDGL